jgi:hypothetical protein
MPAFILGAGFNVDATAEAASLFAESCYIGRFQVDCAYPLVSDTLRECFNLTALPAGKSIEDLFADAIAEGNNDPLAKLADSLRKADHYIANRIARHEEQSSYRRFFDAFGRSSFLTFNYDSLPETVLHNLGLWYPHDGYGVPVATFLPPWKEHLHKRQSSAFVLHLHGSLCIATSETELYRRPGEKMWWLSPRDRPLFKFDPSSIAANFSPYRREPGTDDARDRVIAPVPDKSQGLREAFVRASYVRAEAVLQESEIAVAIGYSFNQHDRSSYEPLLCALRRSPGRRLLVVAPDADAITTALKPNSPGLTIAPIRATFKQWADQSFPGLN